MNSKAARRFDLTARAVGIGVFALVDYALILVFIVGLCPSVMETNWFPATATGLFGLFLIATIVAILCGLFGHQFRVRGAALLVSIIAIVGFIFALAKIDSSLNGPSAKAPSFAHESNAPESVEQKRRLAAREACKTEVLKEYPTANDDKSLLGAEIAKEFREMENNPNHPDWPLLSQDDGPRWITEHAAQAVVDHLISTQGCTYAQALAVVKVPASPGFHYVREYIRSDGVKVPAHAQTNPDGTVNNNWSRQGNINPINGKPGWIPRAPEPEAVEAAKQSAIQLHPALAINGSPLNHEFVARYKRYQTERPAFFDDPSWPIALAEECAQALP